MNIDVTALKAVEREKGIPADTVIEAIESALVTAYRHADGAAKHVRVHVDRKSGEVAVLAQEIGPDGEVVREWDDTPTDFGRIAASTAKQVIVQRLRDAEHEQTFGEYAGKEGDIVSGIVQAHDRRNVQGTVLIDIGKVEAVLPQAEQVPGEEYTHGSRIKAYVVSVARTFRGPQVTVSRTHPHLVRKLFALEVPEIADGSVEIVAVAREAGHRSKIAVRTKVPGLNAKGSCIGPMGQRVRNVMSELHGEKIDIVDWSDDPATFVASALSPARVNSARVVDAAGQGRAGDRARTTSCRWRSARKGRTPAWPPASPAAGSTSAATHRPTTTPRLPRPGWVARRCDRGCRPVPRLDGRLRTAPLPDARNIRDLPRARVQGGRNVDPGTHLCGVPEASSGQRSVACRRARPGPWSRIPGGGFPEGEHPCTPPRSACTQRIDAGPSSGHYASPEAAAPRWRPVRSGTTSSAPPRRRPGPRVRAGSSRDSTFQGRTGSRPVRMSTGHRRMSQP